MIIEYTKTREDAHSPQRANPSDAGLDVFYSATEPQEIISVHPNTSMLVPTGLRFGVPHGYMLEVKNRSSVAAKLNLVVGACVIDAGYDGEVLINLAGSQLEFSEDIKERFREHAWEEEKPLKLSRKRDALPRAPPATRGQRATPD